MRSLTLGPCARASGAGTARRQRVVFPRKVGLGGQACKTWRSARCTAAMSHVLETALRRRIKTGSTSGNTGALGTWWRRGSQGRLQAGAAARLAVVCCELLRRQRLCLWVAVAAAAVLVP